MSPSAQWLVASLTLEEELELERSVRNVEQSPNTEEIGKLCGQLVRQNVMYQRILQQACGYVMELETTLLLAERPEVRGGRWWQFWRR